MTIARILPFDVHGALEALLGPVLMAAPFMFGFDVAAAVVSVTLGALILGVALATHATERGPIPISTHAALDIGFTIALAAGAVVFAIAGDLAAAVFLAGAALTLTLIVSFTRYSPSHR
jgi:hypothetical protein